MRTPSLITRLSRLCAVRDRSSAREKPTYLSRRGENLLAQLAEMELTPLVDVFSWQGTDKLCNLSVAFGPDSGPTRILCAHYDVLNLSSDNMNDNSASLAILLGLAARLRHECPAEPIRLVFLDAEECGSLGACKLAQDIVSGSLGPVESVLNLELCGLGKTIFVDQSESPLRLRLLASGQVASFATPMNDSVFLRRAGIDSCCLGLLPDEALPQLRSWGGCDHWSLCHSRHDSLTRAAADDMEMLLDFLGQFLIGK